MPDTPQATPNPIEALIPEAALKRAVGGQSPGSGQTVQDDLDLAREAAYAFVLRHHEARDEWPGDYVLGAIRLAAGLYRDKANPGVTEAFGSSNVHRRATDIQIEQLLRIGRFQLPQIG